MELQLWHFKRENSINKVYKNISALYRMFLQRVSFLTSSFLLLSGCKKNYRVPFCVFKFYFFFFFLSLQHLLDSPCHPGLSLQIPLCPVTVTPHWPCSALFRWGGKAQRTAIASDQKYMSLSASPYELFGRSRVMKNDPNQCYLSQNYSWWATGLTALAAVCLFISYLGEFMTAQELMVVIYMWRYCSLTSAL